LDGLSIRAEIDELLKSLKGHDKLSEVNKKLWEPIIKTIEERFIQKQHYTNSMHWGWLRIKEPLHVLRLVSSPERYIKHFVSDEVVWFVVEDYKDKMWLYEGNTSFITKHVIPELKHLREYFLVSKKYEWLLCIDHHDLVHGSGTGIVNNMKKFEQLNPQEISRRYSH